MQPSTWPSSAHPREGILSPMSWSQVEVEVILVEMQLGATAQTGGSRCHTTYAHRDGQWVYEAFDEGHIEVYARSEAQIRSLIASEPELFRHILRAVPWRRFSAAYLAGEREAARAHLRDALAYGDGFEHGTILDAMLGWPETPPSDELVELMREKLRDFTAYHVFMDAILWDRSPARAEKGLAYADQLVDMVGETLGCHYLRATFHEQRGDLDASERELLRELERLPEGHSNRTIYEQNLERVRARMSSRS
jgi:hypothetical protein